MESLLASYGSDDEEDEKPPPLARASLFASLPPPRVSDDGRTPSLRTSLFSSLPRPKSPAQALKNVDPAATFETSYRTQSKTGPAPDGVEKPSAGNDTPPRFSTGNDTPPLPQLVKRGSLFSSLPPPKSTGSSLLTPLPAKSQSGSSKRVVKVRPAINMSLLHDDDDDDDDGDEIVQPQAKRHATDSVPATKVTGLAAMLPKPKNSGSALGSGFLSGHHGTLDLGNTTRTEVGSCEAAPQSVHDPSLLQHERHSLFDGADLGENAAGSPGSTLAGAWDGYDHDRGAYLQQDADAMPSSDPYYSSTGFHHNVEGPATEDYNDIPVDKFSEMQACEAGYIQSTNAVDPLAHMLMKERRKGSKPVNVVEVKQADLTATKVREDQLRSTGIAFGPAYKPTSSTKGKPSKLHRRKHQIGSLYYDMKQKEMELAERRSRGYATKSVTQGKYGW